MRTRNLKAIVYPLAIAFGLLCFIYHIVYVQNCNSNRAVEAETLCPSQDIVEWIYTPYGAILTMTEKGLYAEDWHSLEKFKEGDGWITLEEYEAWLTEVEETADGEQEQEDSI